MKRIFLSIFAIFVFFTYVLATPISEGEAREKAMKFMLAKKGKSSARSSQRFGVSGGPGATLTVAETREAFYVFNNDPDGGYVIVSGDDRMPAVLGYSYRGTYNPDEIPDNMRAWLEGYAEQYEYLQTHSDAKGASITTVTGGSISPMLDCHWYQEEPYNNQCPMIDGKRTATGCGATAMAQIMYYHKWPKQTTKVIPAYTTTTNKISMPEIGITTIDWDILTPTYSSASSEQEKEMVATLMRLCGSAVEMDYGLDGSSSYYYMVTRAFVNYFGYNSIGISYEKRSNYSNTVWNQMIYDELKDGRPVFYSGTSSDGGHAFVIDGYDCDDYYHVNWGWGGSEDGYFLLSSLNGFNNSQGAIIGINNKQTNSIIPYAELNNGVLTFYYDNKHGSRSGILLNWNSIYWDSEYKTQVTSAVFDPSCAEYKNLYSTSSMFEGFSNLVNVQGLEYLVTENVTDMGGMFFDCGSLTSLDVSNFDTHNVTTMYSMFYNCSSLTSLNVSNFDTQNVTNMRSMFNKCGSLTSLDVSKFDTRKVTSMKAIFNNCGSLTSIDVSNFDTKNVTDMNSMFYNCSSLTSINISNFDTQNVTDMHAMFYKCDNLTSLDVSNFDTRNVIDMQAMFGYCSSLTSLDVSNFDTQNVIDMSWMFYNCGSLTSHDVSNFDTHNVTTMYSMFYKCSSLTSLNVSNFNTQNVTNMRSMFNKCGSLISLDVSKFDTQNVTNMKSMFDNCGSLTSLDVSNFSTQNVTDMKWMFYNCSSLHTIYAGDDWDTSNVTESEDMFNRCNELVGQAGTKFSDDHIDKEYARIDGGTSEPGYFTYKAPALRGDANGDGEIGMPDVMFVVNYILGTPADTFNADAADANLDGEIGMYDVMYIVQYILNGKFPDE